MMVFFYLGKKCYVEYKGGRGLSEISQLEQDAYILHITGERDFMSRRIKDFYKKQAVSIIKPLVKQYAAIIGAKYRKINFKDTKTRWGSASSTKNLSFNWRIIMAPVGIIEYVVAHEVAHLQEMNHKPSFWRLCEKLCPKSIEKHKWLKNNGHNFMNINI